MTPEDFQTQEILDLLHELANSLESDELRDSLNTESE